MHVSSSIRNYCVSCINIYLSGEEKGLFRFKPYLPLCVSLFNQGRCIFLLVRKLEINFPLKRYLCMVVYVQPDHLRTSKSLWSVNTVQPWKPSNHHMTLSPPKCDPFLSSQARLWVLKWPQTCGKCSVKRSLLITLSVFFPPLQLNNLCNAYLF